MPIETNDTVPNVRVIAHLKAAHVYGRATALTPTPSTFSIRFNGTENAHDEARRLMALESVERVEVLVDFQETTTYTRDVVQDEPPSKPRAFMPTK